MVKKYKRVQVVLGLGERQVSAYLLTLTSCSTRFPNKQDKLDINGAEGGAPVQESIESIYEDIYLFKVGMGL